MFYLLFILSTLIYYLTYSFSHWPSPLFAAVTMEMSCDPWPRAGDQGMDINENAVTGTAHTYYTQVIQLWISSIDTYMNYISGYLCIIIFLKFCSNP